MLIKLWKDFKYLLRFLPILCFLFIFKISTANALIYKGYEYTTNWDTTATKSCNGSSCQLDFYLESPLDFDTDYIGIKLSNFAFTDNWNINVSQYTQYCSQWKIDGTSTTQQGDQEYYYTTLSCLTTTTIGGGQDTLSNNNIMISAKSYNDNWAGSPCWLDSEFQDTFICPVQSNRFWFIRIFVTGGSNDRYAITLDRVKLLLNNDSTEIVSALNQLSTQQINTTTTIQNFNNYVSNTDTTQSNTNSTTALNGISSDFQQHLSGMNELTQFVFLPITFITSMIDSTCQPLIWDIPFVNTRVVVPCLSTIYSGYFGGIVGLFATVMSALLTYRCVMKLLATIKGLLDAEDDKIEVIDL